MSTRTLIKNEGMSSVIGQTNEMKSVIIAPKADYEENQISFTPPSVGPGSTFKCDVFFPTNAPRLISDLLWKVEIPNSSGTDTVEFRDILRFISECEVMINNKKVLDYDNYEKIQMTISKYYQRYGEDNIIKQQYGLDKGDGDTNLDFTLQSIAPGSTRTVYQSLAPLLYEVLMNQNTQKTPKISIKIKLRPNTNASEDIARFCKNATANANPYSLLNFNNMELVYHTRAYANDAIYKNPRPLYPVHMYEDRVESLDLSTSKTWKVSLTTDYSKHRLITGVYYYAIDNVAYGTYNGAGTLNLVNAPGSFTVQVKRRGRDYLDLTSVPLKLIHKNKYLSQKFGHVLNYDPFDADYQNVFTFNNAVSLRHMINHDSEAVKLIEGLTNKENEDYELSYNNPAAISNDVTFHSVIEYVEMIKIYDDGSVEIFT